MYPCCVCGEGRATFGPLSGPANASCHNGYKSCFYRKVADLDDAGLNLQFTAERLFDPATVYKKK